MKEYVICDKCGKKEYLLDAGFDPSLHDMKHADCGGRWIRGREELIHCHICGHDWNYTGNSKARYISCPSCYGKVPNPNFRRVVKSQLR